MKLTPKQKQLIDAMQTTADMQQLRKILNYNSRNLMCMIKRLHNKKYVIKLKKGVYEINKNYNEAPEDKTSKQNKHKFTPKQAELMKAMETTGDIDELEKILSFSRKQLQNLMRYLCERNFVNHINKNTYQINRDYPNSQKTFKPIEIDGKLIDVNKIPEKVREYLWENRQMPCSQLKSITKLPRFYIRQYIYERKMRELPKLREY